MPITFYYGSGSPPAWRVWLALEYKQLPYEMRLLSFDAGDNRRLDFLALNPRARVPTIVDGDFALYESSAIVEYLEEQYPATPQLFPGTTRERARVRRWISEIHDGIANTIYDLGEAVFTATRDSAQVARRRQAVLDELSFIAGQMSGDYLAGKRLTAADLTLYPYVALLARQDRRMPELGMAAANPPALRDWAARIEALPFFDKTLPPHWKAK